MDDYSQFNYHDIYKGFDAPISAFDCGDRCAPYNELHVPFCCDIHHAVPTAYSSEWDYLERNTDLWRLWKGNSAAESQHLADQAPVGRLLIACLGYQYCQRGFRSIACRSFPFFPYVSREGQFLGLAYIWEYEDRCWVISNLQVVSDDYLAQFVTTFDALFELVPSELEVYRGFSATMRRSYGKKHRAITLIHRNGSFYKVSPHNGRLRRFDPTRLPKFGVYQIASSLPFSDEIEP